MRQRSRGLLAAFALLAGLLLTAAACGGSSGSSSSAAGTVPVSMKEYSITVNGTTLSHGSSMNMKPGAVTFQITNDGTMAHDFAIQGPGGVNGHTAQLEPKQSGTVQATLQAGKYEVWCTVPGHKQLGMDGFLNVS